MNIAIICAGGTIDKDYSTRLGGYNFEVGEPAVRRLFERLRGLNLTYAIRSVIRKDSLDMTPEDRQALRRAVEACPEDRVIVTHGTDTLLDTAAVLSAVRGKTIVLTGAMRPEKFQDSDADFNLGLALGAVNVLPPGVYVAPSGRVYPWNKCRKDRGTEMFVEAE